MENGRPLECQWNRKPSSKVSRELRHSLSTVAGVVVHFRFLPEGSTCTLKANTRTSGRIVCRKDAAEFEDVVASNNPAAKTWVNGVSQDCTCSLARMVRPARRTSVENFWVASWQVHELADLTSSAGLAERGDEP